MSASTRLPDETLNPPPESPENAHLPCSSLLLLLQLMCQKARDERRKPETVIRHTNTHTCTRIHHLPSSSSASSSQSRAIQSPSHSPRPFGSRASFSLSRCSRCCFLAASLSRERGTRRSDRHVSCCHDSRKCQACERREAAAEEERQRRTEYNKQLLASL